VTKESGAIVVQPPADVQRESASILDVISRAAKDPAVDVSKLERLLAIQERLLLDQRRTSYMAALARLEAKLPQIAKSGTITGSAGNVRNKYAKIEDVDIAIRPLCAEEGFSFSFDSKPTQGGTEYTCQMSHRDGHSEVKSLVLPLDSGAGRNAVQSAGSSLSYAKRYLLGMHLHLVTRDEDDDATGVSRAPVTAEQADHLRKALASAGGSEERFLRWLNAETFEDIQSGHYERALRFIEEKRKAAR
jgi:ERF superfamily